MSKKHSIHVKKIQERHCLQIKKSNVKHHTGFGWIVVLVRGWGIYIYLYGGYWGMGGVINIYIYIYIKYIINI